MDEELDQVRNELLNDFIARGAPPAEESDPRFAGFVTPRTMAQPYNRGGGRPQPIDYRAEQLQMQRERLNMDRLRFYNESMKAPLEFQKMQSDLKNQALDIRGKEILNEDRTRAEEEAASLMEGLRGMVVTDEATAMAARKRWDEIVSKNRLGAANEVVKGVWSSKEAQIKAYESIALERVKRAEENAAKDAAAAGALPKIPGAIATGGTVQTSGGSVQFDTEAGLQAKEDARIAAETKKADEEKRKQDIIYTTGLANTFRDSYKKATDDNARIAESKQAIGALKELAELTGSGAVRKELQLMKLSRHKLLENKLDALKVQEGKAKGTIPEENQGEWGSTIEMLNEAKKDLGYDLVNEKGEVIKDSRLSEDIGTPKDGEPSLEVSDPKTSDPATQPPTLTSKAEFDALPSGAIYIRDGKKYRKP